MKKINLLLFSLLLILPLNVFAAGTAGISGSGTVTNGSSTTVTVTLHNTAAWNIKIVGTGSTSGCSQSYADVTVDGNNTTKNLTLTCNATSLGTINFKATGDITSADGTNSNIDLNYSVSVVAPRKKETESRLGSLSVSGYDINFDKDKTEYSISVPSTITSITIDAKTLSLYASVNGTGTKEVGEDGEKFVVTCIAEDGTKKDYTINVSVIDENPIKAIIDNKEYTVVKTNRSLIAPTNYTESTVKISDFDIPAYINETTKLTIIGLKDENGKVLYAIYDNGNYKLYNENKSSNILLYISEKNLEGFEETKVKINEEEYKAYRIDERFVLVYAMNIDTGIYNYYKFDKIDNTFQYYNIETTTGNSEKIFKITTIVLTILFVGLLGYNLYSKFIYKNRK